MEIKQAVEKLFKVNGDGGQHDAYGGKKQARADACGTARADWKRAVVTLKEGRRSNSTLTGRNDLDGDEHGVKKYKPTTPSPRFMTVPTFEEITKDKPERSLVRAAKKQRRPQLGRADHGPPPGRRAQAEVPHDRFQAGQARASRRRWRRSSTIRTARPTRAAALRGRREALHPGAAGAGGGRRGAVRARRGADSRATRCRWRRFRWGCRFTTSSWSPGGAARWCGRPGTRRAADVARGRVRPRQLPSGEIRMINVELHGHGRPGGQPGALERQRRQGGPQALAGHPADRARRGHEPGGPSDGRRRRPHLRRRASGVAVGPAGQGRQDARTAGSRRAGSSSSGESKPWDVRSRRVRMSTTSC